jgi:hypothetical protein
VSFAAQWNGSSWADQTTPSPAGATSSKLSGVSCTAVNDCEAAGSYSGQKNAFAVILAEGWNGTAWKVQATPLPASASFGLLAGVSCTSAGTCTAAGYYDDAREEN